MYTSSDFESTDTLSCFICNETMDHLKQSDNFSMSKCDHQCHLNCILPWIADFSESEINCPLCNEKNFLLTQDHLKQIQMRNDLNDTRLYTQSKASKALTRQRKAASVISIGDVVSCEFPSQDKLKPTNLNFIAVVFQVSKTGNGVKVITQHGIICKNTEKTDHFITSDKYRRTNQLLPLDGSLSQYVKQIRKKIFNSEIVAGISFSKLY